MHKVFRENKGLSGRVVVKVIHSIQEGKREMAKKKKKKRIK